TEEDIACLIFRAITNDKRMPLTITLTNSITITETNHNSARPLYCLVYPEKLTSTTLNQICQDIHELLLNDIRLEQLKNNFYTFVILSSDQENLLCKTLTAFRVVPHSLSFQILPGKMLSQLYRNQWTNNRVHDISTEPPWIQLYTSEQVAMGKSTLIQRDIQRIRKIHKTKKVHKICVAFNSKDIDWMKIMDRFWSYYSRSNNVKDIDKKKKLIIYHLNISSCVSKEINDFLFELLFLQHINSSSQMSQCFHVNPNMIFLIEIPSTLDYLDFALSLRAFFYLFFSTVKFPIVQVSPQNNEFEFGKEARYVIKWLQEFFDGNLKYSEKIQQDADLETISDLEKDRMRRFMESNFNEISKSNPAHQCSFFKYLYQQLRPLEIDAKFIQWKHDITESVIEMAKILCCRQYHYIKLNSKEKEQKIESTGQEEFYLCKKWHESNECCFLVSQDGSPLFLFFCYFFTESISILINDTKNVNQKQLDEFQKLNFDLFNWQQDLKKRELILQESKLQNKNEEPKLQTEKKKQLKLLFRILGIPNQGTMKECEEKKVETTESLHDQIVNKLCNDKELSNYVLTFDNILKMIAIFMKIQTNIPVILMGETGCGKTCLINFLGHVANVQLIAVD
ncbi:hypothetical protein RFI_39953, partial [Reticulomyxa filosa]